MSGSNSQDDTWPSLIQEFQSRLWFDKHPQILSEADYREAFRTLCNEYKERDGPRLLNRLRRQHGRIIDFASVIDEANHYHAPDALEPLIWQLLATAVQETLKANTKLSEFVEGTQNLNSKLPSLTSPLLSRFPYDSSVQKPLQEIFREYMDCYGSIFPDAATAPPICLVQLPDRICNIEDFFRSRTTEWEAALQQAEAEEQRRAQIAAASVSSSATSQRGDTALAYGTNAHFSFIRHLGAGTYGEVSEVMEVTSEDRYAQKSIRVRNRHDSRAKDKIEEQVRNEVRIMRKLQHKHIASVLFYVRDTSVFSLIMLPVADCDLRQFLELYHSADNPHKDKIKHMDTWFGCIISALTYAHEEQVKHEDIKPSNILIKNNRPYLADFGSAKDFSHLEASTSVDQVIAGTPVYWAPEASTHGRPADIFALGCVFSEMQTVRQHKSMKEYRDARYVPDVDFGYAFRKNLPAVQQWLRALLGVKEKDSLPAFLLRIILNMLSTEPDDRDTAKQIRKSFRAEEDFLFCSSC